MPFLLFPVVAQISAFWIVSAYLSSMQIPPPNREGRK